MRKTVVIVLGLFLMLAAYSQTSIPKAQTLYIYNFSRLIEWPASSRTGNFIIGVMGSSEVASELESFMKGKKVGVQDIQVVRYKSPSEIQNCHILFVPFVRSKQLPEIISAVSNKNVLIITEKDGALDEGAAINFVIMSDRMKFELRADNASKYGIKLSSRLQEMSSSAMNL
jgi:hypothetical protein